GNRTALAVENASMKLFIRGCCYVFDGQQDEISDAYICATDGGMPQIPATDAFLAEARAQGVEMMREHPSIKLCSLTHICDELAAQLRKGELHMMFDAGIHIKG
ncbi:hypothetical protein ACW9OJ_005356, partial [Escherichia coli]